MEHETASAICISLARTVNKQSRAEQSRANQTERTHNPTVTSLPAACGMQPAGSTAAQPSPARPGI